VEITESMVMHNAAEAACVLEALSVMGVHVSTDDFGTGCSIVRAIIAIAHQLGLKVVAESVETESQLLLRGLGGDQYQGFYRSRPLSAEAFEAFIVARQSSRPRPLLAPA
jgi:diguanylate cyclase